MHYRIVHPIVDASTQSLNKQLFKKYIRQEYHHLFIFHFWTLNTLAVIHFRPKSVTQKPKILNYSPKLTTLSSQFKHRHHKKKNTK